MSVLVVFNPASGQAHPELLDDMSELLSALGPVTTVQPEALNDSSEHVKEVDAAEVIVIAGGDGTFNATINAVGAHERRVFGLVPAGTGNDFARTLGLPSDPLEATRVVVEGGETTIDVCRASGAGANRLFVNGCVGGFPVEVDEAVDDETKRRLGPVAFWVSGVKALRKLQRFTVRLGDTEISDCVAVGVGNGSTVGGGIRLWPGADPGDGMLDVCAVAASNPLDAVTVAAKVKAGTHQQDDRVFSSRGAKVAIECRPEIEFNVDGELAGLKSPALFEVTGRLRVRVPT